MKYVAILVVLLYSTVPSALGQYTLNKVLEISQSGLSDDMAAEPSITCHDNGQACYLNYVPKDQGISIVLNRYDIQRSKPVPTLRFTSDYTDYIQDFYAEGNEIYYIAGNQLFYHNSGTGVDTQYEVPLSVSYDKIQALGTNCILLSHVYNHHPADGKPGIYLTVFDKSDHSFKDSLYTPFASIGLSHLISHWILVQGEAIRIVDPLTGELDTYNTKLQKLNRTQLQVFDDILLGKNSQFRNYIESGVLERQARYKEALKKYPSDSLVHHPNLWDNTSGVKNYIQWLGDTLRSRFTYIEKMIPVDTNSFALTVVPAGHYNEERLLLLFEKGSLVPKKSIVWQVKPKTILEKPEDYFVVDLRNTIYEPFFYGGKVYAWQHGPVSLFQKGRKIDLERRLLNQSASKKVALQLVSYTYP